MKKLEIVKKNKQGEYFVNKGVLDGANGTLSWTEVLDLIDEVLDEGEYPDEILGELSIFGDRILAEKILLEPRQEAKKPPKQVKPKEESKLPLKPTGHTYFLTEQFRKAKAKRKARRAAKAAKALISGPLSSKKSKKKKKQKKYLVTPMSYVKPGGPKCPKCKAPMVKREPKPDQNWKAFLGCVEFPRCKGAREI